MPRKILLLEPNYKNKYPPMGLMKLATYFRNRGDDVRFFKGDLRDLAVELLFEEFWQLFYDLQLGKFTKNIRQFIRYGKLADLNNISDIFMINHLRDARARYKAGDYPKFDIICVTTLFTFYWKEIINTINIAHKFMTKSGRILVGGIASTILYNELEKETGIKPFRNNRGGALLDRPGQIDADSDVIIDDLPLDYSILDEIDYIYPAQNAYFGYMTRGCINHCSFCAVPRLEPNKGCQFTSIKEQISQTIQRFGEYKDLLLLDNNVFASSSFISIINEIKELGYKKSATYRIPNKYSIAISNIRDGYNIRAYTRKIVSMYDSVVTKLPESEKGRFYIAREELGLLYVDTAKIENLLSFDIIFAPLYEKYIYNKNQPTRCQTRYIDFNQGVDARLVTEVKMKKIAETNIRPLRIAFDYWETDPQKHSAKPMWEIYENAVRMAVSNGICNLSNYLLYNTNDDTPEDLYKRLLLNVNLCEELNVSIYSFPMKYHPIDDPNYFDNRNYIGKAWRKKYIRAIQAILNSTHGKIGRGKNFFFAAFGKDIEQFQEILIMPETFIIERYKYDREAYIQYLKNGGKVNPKMTDEVMGKFGKMASQWRSAYKALSLQQKLSLLSLIEKNCTRDDSIGIIDVSILDILKYYRIKKYQDITEFKLC